MSKTSEEFVWWPTLQTMAIGLSFLAMGVAFAAQVFKLLIREELAPENPSTLVAQANLNPKVEAGVSLMNTADTIFIIAAVVALAGAITGVALEMRYSDD